MNNNIVNKVNIVLWDSNTESTPFKTGNTIRGNGFCITYDSGAPYFCQVAMAVGDSHLFTRHRNEGGWSVWTTIGSPAVDQSAAIYEKFIIHCSSIIGVGILHNNIPSKSNNPKEATFA